LVTGAYQSAPIAASGEPRRLGRYELLDKLDAGGMGAIYLARLRGEGGFEKLVVLKVLLPELSESERFVAMFRDEAKIAARLSHVNVCEIYELGEAEGRHFIAMQYLRGVPLTRAMRPAGDPGDHAHFITTAIAQAATGLHHAHELRGPGGEHLAVVHRDISPPNLFITVDGVVKVLDFGIAKARDIDSKTRRDEIKGKQAYMSPEQLVGEELDRRSDIFSLGVVLYEGITGTRLFRRDTDYLIAKAILEEPIDDPRARQPAISPALASACMVALERDREARYPSAALMCDALCAAIKDRGGPLPPAELGARIRERHAGELEAADESYQRATRLARSIDDATTDVARPARPARRRRRVIALALAGVGALAAALITAFAIGRDSAGGAAAIDGGPTDAAPIRAADAAPIGPVDAAAALDARARRPPTTRGFISIDSTPYATIYIDGRQAGVTPLIRYPVKAGRRRVRAVTAAGKSRRFSIDVEPGKLARPRTLRW
jgi:serine/threonine-protein kinase